MKRKSIQHEFVEYIPESLEEGKVYVSVRFATVVHRCCCGCGSKTVTPLSPTDWSLKFDGETISLDPSIGNWSFPCKSHYWIRRDQVEWAPQWSRSQIEAGRAREEHAKLAYFESVAAKTSVSETALPVRQSKRRRAWSRAKRWFSH